jgi:hypothetical protein
MSSHHRSTTCDRPRRPVVTVVREHTGDYHHDGAGDGRHEGDEDGRGGHVGDRRREGDDHRSTDGAGPSLRDAVRDADAALRRVLELAVDRSVAGGELGALVDLLGVGDLVHAAAIELTDHSLANSLAERSAALPFDTLLALKSRATYGERGRLQRHTQLLRTMPHLRAAVRAGHVGAAQLVSIAAEAKAIPTDQRAELDRWFSDEDWLAQDPDVVVELVREQCDRLRPDLAETREVRAVQGNRLALQPALDGTGTGWFAYDADSYARVAAALEAAAVPPCADDANSADDQTGGAGDGAVDPSDDGRVPGRQRQLADALVGIADHYLAGSGGLRFDPAEIAADTDADGTTTVDRVVLAGRWDRWAGRAGRARTATTVVVDVAQLTDPHSHTGRAARQLWATFGRQPALTPAGIERIGSDTDLSFLLVDGHTLLGTTDPTASIPRAVRRTVHARDQGCRFPSCRAPAAWCDLHHVIARHHGGPTTVDNLVALCRRHHTLVTAGRWRLDMTADGIVTVRRGRHRHSSRPPLHDHLHPPDPPDPPPPTSGPDGRDRGNDPPDTGGSDPPTGTPGNGGADPPEPDGSDQPPRMPDPPLPF